LTGFGQHVISMLSLTLPGLWHCHALFLPHNFDSFYNFKLVTKWNTNRIKVLIVQLQHGLQVLNPIINEALFILLEIYGGQKLVNLREIALSRSLRC
jgi:hypothetical protein